MSIEFIIGSGIGFLIGVVLMCLIAIIKRAKNNELIEELIVCKHRINKMLLYRKSIMRYDYNERLY